MSPILWISQLQRKIKIQIVILLSLALATATLTAFNFDDSEIEVITKQIKHNLENRVQISNTLSPFIKAGQFPTEAEFNWFDKKETLEVSYDLPRSDGRGERREFYGYLIRLYYQNSNQKD